LSRKNKTSRKSQIFETIGLGVATASIVWVLVNLFAFYLFGYVLVGEENRLILISEIALITFGLFCFLADLRLRITSEP
jgi:cation transporter-like permease